MKRTGISDRDRRDKRNQDSSEVKTITSDELKLFLLEAGARWARHTGCFGKDFHTTHLQGALTVTSFFLPYRIVSISPPCFAAWHKGSRYPYGDFPLCRITFIQMKPLRTKSLSCSSTAGLIRNSLMSITANMGGKDRFWTNGSVTLPRQAARESGTTCATLQITLRSEIFPKIYLNTGGTYWHIGKATILFRRKST